jgi:hypothetical protein
MRLKNAASKVRSIIDLSDGAEPGGLVSAVLRQSPLPKLPGS